MYLRDSEPAILIPTPYSATENVEEPQKEIILCALRSSGVHAAKQFGITKQRVSKLLKRWKDWIGGNVDEIPKNSTEKKQKQTPQLKPKRTVTRPKFRVISFRVDQWVLTSLQRQLEMPIFKHLSSENEVARAIVAVYLSNQ